MSEKKQAFFNLGTGIDPVKKGKSRTSLNKVGCAACGLENECNTPNIDIIGIGLKKILIINEYPSKHADEKGFVFSKEARLLLKNTLDEIGINLDTDCWSVSAVRCRPENDREPTQSEIVYCRPKLLRTIEKLQPNVIIPMGLISTKALIGHRISGRLTGTKMSAFFGEAIPDQELQKWICPTYSPEYLQHQLIWQRGEQVINPVLLRYWKRAVKIACKKTEVAFYNHNYISDIFTTKDPKEATRWINKALKEKNPIAFDYETDGLKPHEKPHHIVCASFSDGLFGYAFPFFDDEDFQRAWYRLMKSKHIGKIAHKMDFENGWTKFAGIGDYVNNWEWDTCLAAHCVNNHKPVGEKFWVYVYLGILNYDDSVDKYLKADKEKVSIRGCNAFNNISQANLDKLLIYNAQDSHFCYKLYEIQKSKLSGKFRTGFKTFLNGAEILSKVQNEGFLLNMKSLDKNNRILTRKIDRSFETLKAFPEWEKWKGAKAFNPSSEPQLSKMLYDILKYKKPAPGESQTDKKQLLKIGSDFTKAILPYRELKKMRDTYLAQFNRENVDGVIRGFYNLHNVVTFRSSSDSPNLQNMPARDPVALKYVMSNLIPRLGNKFIEWDYKGVEVTMSATYHKDPNMISYLKDPSTDMHGDTTADVYLCKAADLWPGERQAGKNNIVFPAFYGSGVKQVAPNMWYNTSPERRADLKDKGIKNYRDFYRHMEEVLRIFWNERFPVYRDWKRKIWKDYLKKGYIELLTGFKYYGPAEFTQITNAQIQGSAFHVLLWTLSNVYPIIKKNYENSYIIGQIHDAMVGDINPKDENEIDGIIKEYGTKKVREHWNWLTLPFQLEKEATEVNGTWNTMVERGYL